MKPERIQEPQSPAPMVSEPPTVAQLLPGWRVEQTLPYLCREFEFSDFSSAVVFVSAVARLAVRQQHYPEIELRDRRVLLRLTSPTHGGVSYQDEALARAINQISQ